MAIRMPSQRKLQYFDTRTDGSEAISNDSFTSLGSGGTSGHFNLVKDLSLLNRYGLTHTLRDGTPLVYRVRVTLHGQTWAGTGAATAGFAGSDSFTTLKIDGAQNTWVMKEASKAFHKAREEMFAAADVKKSDRGAYSHTIRYNYDGASDTWGTPIDGDGAALNGGTWDASQLTYADDNSFQLALVGNGDDQETDSFAGGFLSIGHAYLVNRANMQADTNPHVSETPAKYSVLNRMLSGDSLTGTADRDGAVRVRAKSEQDNPPYEVLDISDSGDIQHDVTEPVELGRLTVGGADGYTKSMVIDVPFGIMDAKAVHYSQADDSEVFAPLWGVELLKISEMTG